MWTFSYPPSPPPGVVMAVGRTAVRSVLNREPRHPSPQLRPRTAATPSAADAHVATHHPSSSTRLDPRRLRPTGVETPRVAPVVEAPDGSPASVPGPGNVVSLIPRGMGFPEPRGRLWTPKATTAESVPGAVPRLRPPSAVTCGRPVPAWEGRTGRRLVSRRESLAANL